MTDSRSEAGRIKNEARALYQKVPESKKEFRKHKRMGTYQRNSEDNHLMAKAEII